MPVYYGEALTLLQLATPAAPALLRFGTAGETTYTYRVVAKRGSGETLPGATASVTNGAATLTSATAIRITPPYVQGATQYDIYRTVGGATQGKLGTINATVAGTTQLAYLYDRGQTAEEADLPDLNTTGLLTLQGLAVGSLLFVNEAHQVIALAPGSNGSVLTMVDGLPAWD